MTKQFIFTDEHFADIQMLRYHLDDFESLTLRQKLYIYYLAKATLCGRDITTDQFGRYNIRIRRTLEAIYKHYDGDRGNSDFLSVVLYLKRVWFSNGIYHHYGCEKFSPKFTEEYFRKIVKETASAIAKIGNGKVLWNLPINEGSSIDGFLDDICPVIFNPTLLAKRVNLKTSEDVVCTSACNYYENVTQNEVEEFYAKMRINDDNKDTPISYGLNSTLHKDTETGKITEDVWCETGRYGAAIRNVMYWLRKACTVSENANQKKILNLLIEYYKSGDLHKFDEYSIEWLKEKSGRIDFINGFIEVYGDPLGLKGSWEGIVTYKDPVATQRTQTISNNAQWFEDHSPVARKFKKTKVVGVTANVVCAAMLGGDEYPSTAIGINLPNADWIRAKHGSKSITICNLTHAYSVAARGNGFLDEFVIDDETRSIIIQYGDICDDLHTDLHECLGHGSGKLLPGVSADALGSYGSTIEEARADLFGLYYIADYKLIELGLIQNKTAFHAKYYAYMMNGLLTQLTRIEPGKQIEEAHMRNRALVTRWTLDNYPNAVSLICRNGKKYVQINDYELMRTAFATLLTEIQRIKSEGDYEAAKNLIEKYAVNVDCELHNEVLSRYKNLGIAPYKGFINPRMRIVENAYGEPIDVDVDYTEMYDQQMLRYSDEYGFL